MKQKIVDGIVSALLKRGVAYEAHNFTTEIDIPTEEEKESIRVRVIIDNMTLTVRKED